ncbi:hypothetical protein ACLOJK_005026, partial [Asimina triloba]
AKEEWVVAKSLKTLEEENLNRWLTQLHTKKTMTIPCLKSRKVEKEGDNQGEASKEDTTIAQTGSLGDTFAAMEVGEVVEAILAVSLRYMLGTSM